MLRENTRERTDRHTAASGREENDMHDICSSVMSSVWIRRFHVKPVIPVLQDSVEHEKRRVGIVARELMYK